MSSPHASAPSHGHPDSEHSTTRDQTQAPATSTHPKKKSSLTFEPTVTNYESGKGGQSTSTSTSTSQLARTQEEQRAITRLNELKQSVRSHLRQFPDFPSKGILFEDIMPIFASPYAHLDLIHALGFEVQRLFPNEKIKYIIGLESRGFLFGPSLAMRLNAGFVPVRKQGKLPGRVETVGYKKEYGEDFFEIQSDAFKQGDKVLIVDDIIATGGSAAAAGSLVKKLGGVLVGYLFIMELDFLKGREKLDAPVHTLLSGQDADSKK